MSKMRYFLKQDNWGCIIHNQLKFDIKINILATILWDEPLLCMSDFVNGYKRLTDLPEFYQTKNSLSSHNFFNILTKTLYSGSSHAVK